MIETTCLAQEQVFTDTGIGLKVMHPEMEVGEQNLCPVPSDVVKRENPSRPWEADCWHNLAIL